MGGRHPRFIDLGTSMASGRSSRADVGVSTGAVKLWKLDGGGTVRDAKGRRELSSLAKRLVLVAFVLGLLLFSALFVSLFSASTWLNPVYWASFVVWAAIARLWLPARDAIPHRRKLQRGILQGPWVAIIMLSAGVLTYLYPITRIFAAAGVAGFPVGLALVPIEMLTRYRLRRCERCERETWFIPDQGKLYCGVCGHRLPAASETQGPD